MLNRFRHSERAGSRDTYENESKKSTDLRDLEQEAGRPQDDQPVHYLTFRVFVMGVVVSIGGMIFGYDTGTKLLQAILRVLTGGTRSNFWLLGDEKLLATLWRRQQI
jgi:hypothetical protein